MRKLVTKTEAAKLLGVSRGAVYKAIKENRLTVVRAADGREMIDSMTMHTEWANKSQRRIDVGPRSLRPREERVPSGRISRTVESIPEYEESRARTEHLKAELLELERKQKESLLVPAAEIEAKWVEIVTQARTKMLGIPTKAKQRIPDLDTDAMGVLEDIVRETLEDLSSTAGEEDE